MQKRTNREKTMLYLQRNQKYYSLIKMKDMEESKKKLWTEIIRFIITVLSAVLTALGVNACTMSMTISKTIQDQQVQK